MDKKISDNESLRHLLALSKKIKDEDEFYIVYKLAGKTMCFGKLKDVLVDQIHETVTFDCLWAFDQQGDGYRAYFTKSVFQSFYYDLEYFKIDTENETGEINFSAGIHGSGTIYTTGQLSGELQERFEELSARIETKKDDEDSS